MSRMPVTPLAMSSGKIAFLPSRETSAGCKCRRTRGRHDHSAALARDDRGLMLSKMQCGGCHLRLNAIEPSITPSPAVPISEGVGPVGAIAPCAPEDSLNAGNSVRTAPGRC